jgi:hypothetical protein
VRPEAAVLTRTAVLFIGGPLDGQVHDCGGARTIVAEWPEPLRNDVLPVLAHREPHRMIYEIGRFGRSDDQWLWVGYPAGRPPSADAVWRAFLAPGVRQAMSA